MSNKTTLNTCIKIVLLWCAILRRIYFQCPACVVCGDRRFAWFTNLRNYLLTHARKVTLGLFIYILIYKYNIEYIDIYVYNLTWYNNAMLQYQYLFAAILQ